jgi:hypothetical protein
VATAVVVVDGSVVDVVVDAASVAGVVSLVGGATVVGVVVVVGADVGGTVTCCWVVDDADVSMTFTV